MAMFKCKMCGGTLEINNSESTATCEYCGTKQTLPQPADDVMANLYNRANNLRLKCEFDRAEQIYEQILALDNTQAEAHWGVVLCKYGIEYVEDPGDFKRVPTCHRTLFESILADPDYLSAIEYADAEQKGIYEKEAAEIDRLQQKILEIVHQEPPYDVFLCYKETDENGRRTPDSAIANDIYHQLTQEGFKVFYAAITLEDKLGREYEPYIFAALHSAKIMLVIGTKPEYFTAIWVKNEWSRFLKLMGEDRTRLLIPCYRDMDAYELPEEFSHLQAQDMSKIGFISDVIRGIQKVLGKGQVLDTQEDDHPRAEPLLRRAFLFLEDGDFLRADELCEQVLNLEPENAQAYVGKLMAEFHVKSQTDLAQLPEPFEENNNYEKALRFADAPLKKELTGYMEQIKRRNEEHRQEEIYQAATNLLNQAKLSSDAQRSAEQFESISGWKDAKVQVAKARTKVEELRAQEEAKRKRFQKWMKILIPCACAIIALVVVLLTFILPSGRYNSAQEMLEAGRYDEAIAAFSQLGDFQDAPERVKESHYQYAEALLAQGHTARAAIEFGKAGNFSDAHTRSFALWDQVAVRHTIAVGGAHTVGIKANGAVVAVSSFLSRVSDLEDWSDIIAVAAGDKHTVGLKADGTVVATGYNDDGQCDVENWSDIVAISAGDEYTVGLKADGTVVAVGNNYYQQCRVENWSDIIAISAGDYYTVGLRADGTVVAVSRLSSSISGVENWSDITAISAKSAHTLGLKADGTVVAVGYDGGDVGDWSDIVAIAAGYDYTIGIKADGTAVAVDDYENENGQCDVGDWSNIVDVVAGGYDHSVGLRTDGTVVTAGYTDPKQYDIESWTDMKVPQSQQ